MFSWTIIVVLSIHLIGVHSYGVDKFYYRAAKVINTGVGALTIPLASAVCARAAVTYGQQRRHGFTVRQAAALADQGWTSPDVLLHLLHHMGVSYCGSG